METMISNLKVYDLDESVLASGYPMLTEVTDRDATPHDFKRAISLAIRESSEGHDNFLSGILVSFNVTCSIKMWTEFERYHFAQIVSSQSTMHRLATMDIEKQCVSYVDKDILDRIIELQKKYEVTHDTEDRLKLLYSCPTGLCLTARVSTNLRQLKTLYKQRYNHSLPEWRQFCKEMVDLIPLFGLIVAQFRERELNGRDGLIVPLCREVSCALTGGNDGEERHNNN